MIDTITQQAQLEAANERIHQLEDVLEQCRMILDQYRHSNGATPPPRLEPPHVRQ